MLALLRILAPLPFVESHCSLIRGVSNTMNSFKRRLRNFVSRTTLQCSPQSSRSQIEPCRVPLTSDQAPKLQHAHFVQSAYPQPLRAPFQPHGVIQPLRVTPQKKKNPKP